MVYTLYDTPPGEKAPREGKTRPGKAIYHEDARAAARTHPGKWVLLDTRYADPAITQDTAHRIDLQSGVADSYWYKFTAARCKVRGEWRVAISYKGK